jgi:hypothetical protein
MTEILPAPSGRVGGINVSNAKGVGAQIFFLSTTAIGLRGQQMNDQAIDYAERAIALAEANPDAGYPAIGTFAFCERFRTISMPLKEYSVPGGCLRQWG